ncbi:Hypothetical protein R9X50_00495400 [Acrodontium crateriforme]|uniref:TFIIIC transcription initiation factor complex subunits Tfc3 n=1 Tax=Acrodontium crateriforme TaxID=150365 RepID=A0AAQ3R8S3_9PEZI|nr:Hypothetical protein R9X50_00495400 [Acrodontium crateriforme]
MASDFDGLVGALLDQVALTGRYGFGFEELEKCAAVILDTPANPELLVQAWDWLANHMEIETRQVDDTEAMDLDQTGDASTEPDAKLAAVRARLAGRRLFVSEARMWNAIAGHARDFKRLPRLEFDCLSIIAQRGATGILQPELVRITGQDKRSVPKRTDLLASKGYIVKYPVLAETGRGIKTSLLKLKKYETDSIDQIVMNYETWFSEAMRILKAQPNWLVAYQDLRIGLGIEGKKRETRVLARCVRRLANAGCINRIVVRERVNATEVGRPVRCLQLVREPSMDDRVAWETIGLRTQSRRVNSVDVGDNVDEDDDDEDEEGEGDEEGEDEDGEETFRNNEIEDVGEAFETTTSFPAAMSEPQSRSESQLQPQVLEERNLSNGEHQPNQPAPSQETTTPKTPSSQTTTITTTKATQPAQPTHQAGITSETHAAIRPETHPAIASETPRPPSIINETISLPLEPVSSTTPQPQSVSNEAVGKETVSKETISLPFEPELVSSTTLQPQPVSNETVSLPLEPVLSATPQPQSTVKRGRGRPRKVDSDFTKAMTSVVTPVVKTKRKYTRKEKVVGGGLDAAAGPGTPSTPGAPDGVPCSGSPGGVTPRVVSSAGGVLAVGTLDVAAPSVIAPNVDVRIDASLNAPMDAFTTVATADGSPAEPPTTSLSTGPPATGTPVVNPLTIAARQKPFASSPITSSTPKKRGRPTKQMVAERERLALLTPQTATRKSTREKPCPKALIVKLKVSGIQLKNIIDGKSAKTVVKPVSTSKDTAQVQSVSTPFLQIIRPYHGGSIASKGMNESIAHPTALDEPSKDLTIGTPSTETTQYEDMNEEDDEIDQPFIEPQNDENSEDDAYVPPDGDESQHSELIINDSSDEDFSPKKAKPRTYKRRAVTKVTAESISSRYKSIVLEIIRNHGSVYPGNGELWQPFTKVWKRTHSSLPPQDAIFNAVEELVTSGELNRMVFSFESATGGLQNSTLLALSSVDATPEKIKEVEAGVAAAWPAEYHPARHWARDSFVPVDSMVVTRTTKGLSWADKEAQSFGYANAEERKLTLTQKNARKGQTSTLKSTPKAAKATKTPKTPKAKPVAKATITTPSVLPVGYDSEDYESDTSLPRVDPGITLQSHPSSMSEILEMASRLGYPPAGCDDNPQEKYDKDVDRVKQWELAIISGKNFHSKAEECAFINYSLNQPHTLPILGESEWTLKPADGRAKSRNIPYTAQDNSIGQTSIFYPPVMARKQTLARQELASSPAPSVDAEEEAPKPKYKSRKRKVKFDEDDNISNTEVDAQSGHDRPFKRNKRATSSFKDVDRLVTAIALVRCICGGIQMHRMNWDLIAHALSFRYEGNFLRQRWSYFRNVHEGNVQRVQAALREPFLAAYEKGELPIINFQNLAATDMPALFDWVETVVLPLPEEDPSQLPSLPSDSAILQKRYQESGSLQYYEQHKDSYHQNVTDMHRRDLALAFVHGYPLSETQKDFSDKTDDLILLKSWCRAVAMTKQKAYKADVAAKKLGVFPGAMIKRANRELLDGQILSQEKKDRQLPGRNYYLSAAVYKQFKRWPEPEHIYLRKIIDSRERLLTHFRHNNTIKLSYDADDADLIVFHNMVAQGQLRTYSDIPERNDDFDAPWPRLTAWGYTDFDYRTKAVDKTRLTFPIVYEKTPSFSELHGLKPIPVPLTPAPIPNEPGLRIPLWSDINGALLDDAWDMVLRSILHLVVFRPGITSNGIEVSHKGKLGLWEVEMVVKWMEDVGIVTRWAAGATEDGVWNGGWKPSLWWYCAFDPLVASWRVPTS